MHFDGVASNLVPGGKALDVAFSPALRTRTLPKRRQPSKRLLPRKQRFGPTRVWFT